MVKSKCQQVIEEAFKLGYRVKDQSVFSPYRKEPLRCQLSKAGYFTFSIRHFTGNRETIAVHRLVAYQKYGDELFDSGLVVRHRNGNSLDNSEDNIVIGTHQQNMDDKLPEMCKKVSIFASTNVRKFTDEEMEEIRRLRREGWKYSDLMVEFEISSKGTLHYILNTKYQTKV